MPNEYVLQKRTLSNWSYVTWYSSEEEAKRNFDRVIKGDTGYSWRVVKLTTICENLLDGEKDNTSPDADDVLTSQTYKTSKPEPIKAGWGGNTEGWGDIKPASSHGLSGSVWVINRTLKQKKRVPAAEADKMLQEGWERGGPRTVV